MKRYKGIVAFVAVFFSLALSYGAQRPVGLMTDLLEHTEVVTSGGYVSGNVSDWSRNYGQIPLIYSEKPCFSWIVNDSGSNVLQTAYHILVSDNKRSVALDKGNLWDSGVVESGNSLFVPYGGEPLQPGRVYHWKVRSYNNGEASPWSEIKSFKTAPELYPYKTAAYPLRKVDREPASVVRIDENRWLADFGKAAFAQPEMTLYSDIEREITVHLGEVLKEGRIDREPGGSRRYAAYTLSLRPGKQSYRLELRSGTRNTGPAAIPMPSYIGEVYPFRYCEIEGYPEFLNKEDVLRANVTYPFDDAASSFASSDTVLNQIWELSKYSVKATSFAGIYVDGDRERIPYEADVLINQLCHYAVDREYSMARNSHEYLLFHPTWPTEWSLQTVQIAWYDYLYTGDSRSIAEHYDLLKNKALTVLATRNGLISTEQGQTEEFLKSIHLKNGKLKDIVDWPHSGILGLGKNEGGETDGFDFRPVNAVVNAFYYRALVLLQQMAETLGREDDAICYRDRAKKVKNAFNRKLLRKGIYVDGIGSKHSSLHANMFALAFGLVPEKNTEKVLSFIRSRGMACSVYGAQFLMDALYEAYEDGYALQLLTSTGERSWYNMIRAGSTITMEAWDNKYKPNQDWNHAWGAVPANIIPRRLMGIEPLTPGFGTVRIMPQPASLQWASMAYPTIRGKIEAAFKNDPGKSFEMTVVIPANMEAEIYLPRLTEGGYSLTVDGVEIDNRKSDQPKHIYAGKTGSGKHTFRIESR